MADTVTLRTVDRFPEPLFTELVNAVLNDPDRQAMRERFLAVSDPPPTPTLAQQVRVGAYAGDTLVGWSHGFLWHAGALYVSDSAVVPDFRRRGIYTSLMAAMEREALALGCTRVESHHRAANASVLIAKLKAGYVIIGTEFTAEMGLLVKMAKRLEPSRQALHEARSGTIEACARFFDGRKA